MSAIFLASLVSVLKVFSLCGVGAILARTGVMHLQSRRDLSKIIMMVTLPALLFSKLSVSANAANLLRWCSLPLVAALYIGLGLLIGQLVSRLARVPRELHRSIVTAIAFGNSGYIPIPLIAAIAVSAPLFANDPTAGSRGIAYISLYLVVMSPSLWGVGYPYLAERKFNQINWLNIIPPPIYAVFAAILIGLTPPLRHLVIPAGAPLRVLLDSAELLGQATIPCALLVLGANIGDRSVGPKGLPLPTVAIVLCGRLLLMPMIGLATVAILRHFALIPTDPMFAMVLLVEASVPSATALILMCQLEHRGEKAMTALLFWGYLVSVPILTLLISFFLWFVGLPR
jgi:predicted permease